MGGAHGAGESRGPLDAVVQGYEKVQNLVVRPRRHLYDVEELGPTTFTFGGVHFARTDVTLLNLQGFKLRCSYWERKDPSQWQGHDLIGCNCSPSGGLGPQGDARPSCVVYCHGNAGSRLESIDVLMWALQCGCSFFAFDFAGSGISEGDHVSLGWNEQHDISVVVHHLKKRGVASIVLWGRSMGAVSSLLYCDQTRDRPQVDALVLDSPFACFDEVATSVVEQHSWRRSGRSCFVPGCVAAPLVSIVTSSIKASKGFSPSELDPRAAARRVLVPALFLVAEEDFIVPPEHGKELYSTYAGATGLLLFNGDHNSRRPTCVYKVATKFLEPLLNLPPKERRPAVEDPIKTMEAPWQGSIDEKSALGRLQSLLCSSVLVRSCHCGT